MIDSEIFESDVEIEGKELGATHYDLLNDDQYVAQFLSVDDVCLQAPEFEEEEIVEEMPMPLEHF